MNHQSVPFRPPRKWLKVLFFLFGLFVVGIIVLVITDNPILAPTVILLGNFMFPIAFVAFFYENRRLSQLTLPTVGLCFFYGGVLGSFTASFLEAFLVPGVTIVGLLLVALIEEAAKPLGVFVIARHRKHISEINGIILGAAAGMGFAALESVGYTFAEFLNSGGSLSVALGVTLLRALISPFGHGAWTAILTGVLFAQSNPYHFRLTQQVIFTYLAVVTLHALWDIIPTFLGSPTLPGINFLIAQAIIGGISFYLLYRLWQEAKKRQIRDEDQ